MKTKALLTAIAAIEIPAGVGLLLIPSTAARLLIGQPLDDGAALVVARVAGAALIALGLACWLERDGDRDRQSPPAGLLTGLLVYNSAVPLVVLHGHHVDGTSGPGLWAAALLHLALAAWIAACVFVRPGARAY